MEASYFTISWWFLPYTDMNQPWMHTRSPSWTSLPPPFILQGHPSAPALSTLSNAFNLDWQSISLMVIHVSVLFSQVNPPSPFPTESKSLFFTSVSLLNSHLFLTIAALWYIRSSEPILITECLYPLTCISSFSLAPSHWWPPFLFSVSMKLFFSP